MYRDFMIDMLKLLEPRHVCQDTVLFQSIEEVEEIFFIVKGHIDIGFEINRQPKYVLRLGPGGVVGIFNITYNKKTMFNYKIKHTYDGYTIRKDNWK